MEQAQGTEVQARTSNTNMSHKLIQSFSLVFGSLKDVTSIFIFHKLYAVCVRQ
jgi:hypothetical protein